ncbi:MAG TPA: hypothetical protein VIU10_03745 [Candidatus Udaeobacter sp.]
MKKSTLASIGLRAKTARAIAVVLGGSIDSPVVLTKLDIPLADPKMPATAQPYHEVMDLPWEESQRAAQKSAAVIESIARKALARLIRELQSKGVKICGAGIVGAKDRDLSRIGNPHIRAHAAEGVLFRQVLDRAADANGLRRRSFPDREFERLAAAELGHQTATVKRKLNDIRRSVAPPWRADEKQAATAAWLVLHGARK